MSVRFATLDCQKSSPYRAGFVLAKFCSLGSLSRKEADTVSRYEGRHGRSRQPLPALMRINRQRLRSMTIDVRMLETPNRNTTHYLSAYDTNGLALPDGIRCLPCLPCGHLPGSLATKISLGIFNLPSNQNTWTQRHPIYSVRLRTLVLFLRLSTPEH